MADAKRPTTTNEEIERTGRDQQVAGGSEKADEGFGTPGTPAEQVPEGHDNDFA